MREHRGGALSNLGSDLHVSGAVDGHAGGLLETVRNISQPPLAPERPV
jgi:hypothetical protein